MQLIHSNTRSPLLCLLFLLPAGPSEPGPERREYHHRHPRRYRPGHAAQRGAGQEDQDHPEAREEVQTAAQQGWNHLRGGGRVPSAPTKERRQGSLLYR